MWEFVALKGSGKNQSNQSVNDEVGDQSMIQTDLARPIRPSKGVVFDEKSTLSSLATPKVWLVSVKPPMTTLSCTTVPITCPVP